MNTQLFGHAAVASPHDLASSTGRTILAMGGNAIEAMVAMAATIAVVYPHMNSIGGDAFWLIADRKRKVRYIEACGRAGSGATIARYRDRGYDTIPARGADAALTVPGTVSGWELALDMAKAMGGKLPLDVLLSDAIGHARMGVPVSASQGRVDPREFADLAKAPGFAKQFLKDGKPLSAGSLMQQPSLAATLEQLCHTGLRDFYAGDIARELSADLETMGSPVTREDLRRQIARWAEPLSMPIRGGTLYNSPPPTQGLASLLILGQLYRLAVPKPESLEHIHGLVEAVSRAIHIRNRVITDPDFAEQDPSRYLEPAILNQLAGSISMARATTPPSLDASGDTVWMGAIDQEGMAVSFIQSVFWDFGSGAVSPATGILLQNRGMSFSLDESALNALKPGRRPFHTLNPPLALFEDGRIVSYGCMGGDAQPQIQAQLFSRWHLGADIGDALAQPRFVLGRPDTRQPVELKLENRFDDQIVSGLERLGHPVRVTSHAWHDDFGHAGMLVRHSRDGRIEAAHDPRADGGANGF